MILGTWFPLRLHAGNARRLLSRVQAGSRLGAFARSDLAMLRLEEPPKATLASVAEHPRTRGKD